MAEYEARLLTRTGATAAILEPDEPSYGRGLSNTGRCSFSTSLDSEGLTEAMVEPWASEVLLLRRENPSSAWQVAHDGPIVESDCDDESGKATITAGPVSEWMARRWQRRSVAYARENADLDVIANDLVWLAQHPEPPFAYSSRADFKVAGSTHLTGTLRTLRIASTARVNWLEKLNELAAGSPSFDWDIETTWAAGVRSRTFRTWSPARGSAVSTPLLRGYGMVGLGKRKVGSRAANYVESIGAGGTALTSDAKQDTGNQDTYGLVELFDSASDISVKARLNDRALEQLRIRKPPTSLVRAGYQVGENLPWRFATLGDRILVRGSRGPLVVDGTFRIVAEDVKVSPGGVETVSLTFQDPLA